MNKVEKISLDGAWNLKQENKSIDITTQIPGSVFETLIEKNFIEEGFGLENRRDGGLK